LKNYSVGLIQAKSSGCTLLHKTYFTLYGTSKKKLWLLGFQTVFFKKTAVFSAGSGKAEKLAEIFSKTTQKVQVKLRILYIENIFLNFIPGKKKLPSMTTSAPEFMPRTGLKAILSRSQILPFRFLAELKHSAVATRQNRLVELLLTPGNYQ